MTTELLERRKENIMKNQKKWLWTTATLLLIFIVKMESSKEREKERIS
jgi:hypothetical protein